MIRMFAGRNEQWKALLNGEQLRDPDETFDREVQLNLGGGVTARLLWYGATHSRGDELVFVDPDKTLISGDVVQNKVGPGIYGEGEQPRAGSQSLTKPRNLMPSMYSRTTARSEMGRWWDRKGHSSQN